jgi:hypothetical protein
MKNLVFMMMACMGLIHAAQARESRQEVLQACAQQAKDKALAGDAYAEFMRACLKPPEGYKAPVFDAAQPPQAGNPARTLQPALTSSASSLPSQKP